MRVLLTLLLIANCFTASSQFKFGAEVAGNLTHLRVLNAAHQSVTPHFESKYPLGYSAGLLAEYDFRKPKILYTQLGVNYKVSNVHHTWHVYLRDHTVISKDHYLQIPLQVGGKFLKHWSVAGGVNYCHLLSVDATFFIPIYDSGLDSIVTKMFKIKHFNSLSGPIYYFVRPRFFIYSLEGGYSRDLSVRTSLSLFVRAETHRNPNRRVDYGSHYSTRSAILNGGFKFLIK